MIKNTTEYVSKTIGMAHQDEFMRNHKDRTYFGIFWEMGVGKSKALVDNIGHLYCSGQIDGAIIVSDAGCYEGLANEFKKHLPSTIPISLAIHSSSMNRSEQAAVETIMTAQDNRLDILLMNVEGFSGDKSKTVAYRFIQSHYILFAIDEATSIKNIKAKRTQNLLMLARQTDYRRILTGTPITRSPLDVYAMCEFLSPGCLGHSTFSGFRSQYAMLQLIRFGKGKPFHQVIGYRNLNHLGDVMSHFCSRKKKEECIDLPEKVYEEVTVPFTDKQRQLYDQLRQQAFVLHEQGLLTVTSAVTAINKLQQICCGHMKLDDGTIVHIDSNRVKSLVELLEKIGQKTVVWCAFREDVKLIMAALKGREEYAVDFYGDTVDRRDSLSRFMTDPKCMWWVGTTSTGGKGIDGLQNVCSYQVYFSNTYNLEDRLQSEDRLHRRGQENKVTVIDMAIPKTIDVKILVNLKSKKDLASQVLSNFKELVMEQVN